MFLILNSSNLIVDISEYAHYIRKQSNGVIISCEQSTADAIYSANTDKIYPLEPVGYLSNGHFLAEIDKIPAWVTAGNYFYNAGEFYASDIRQVKLSEVGAACTAAICAGIEVGGKRYSLTDHDQIEIMAQISNLQRGAEFVPYHADGELCRMFSASEFAAIGTAATAHVFYHRTYCNHINAWIRRTESTEELSGITYGAELPADLAENMNALLEAAEGAV